jgi:hypothetical protein
MKNAAFEYKMQSEDALGGLELCNAVALIS